MTRNYSEHGVGSLTGQTPEVAGGQVTPAAHLSNEGRRESSVEVLSSKKTPKSSKAVILKLTYKEWPLLYLRYSSDLPLASQQH